MTAVSSIAYAIAAALVLYIGGEYATIVALGLAILAIGSALYHGTGKKWAQRLDEVGMYMAVIPLMWAAVDLFWQVPDLLILAHLVVFVALHEAIDSFVFLPLMVLAAIIFAGYFGSTLLAVIALTVFGLAVGIRSWGPHNAPVQHSAWHFMTGAAFVVLFAAI